MPMPFCQSVAQQVFLTLSQNVYGCGSTYKLLVRVAPVRVISLYGRQKMHGPRKLLLNQKMHGPTWSILLGQGQAWRPDVNAKQFMLCFIDNRVLAISCAWASVASITYQPHGSHLRVSCCENASQKSTSKHSGQVQASSAFHGATAKSL